MRITNRTRLIIGGITYRFHRKRTRVRGDIDFDRRVIHIQEGMERSLKDETYLHEIIHAVCNHLGLEPQGEGRAVEAKHERLVNAIAGAVMMVLADNAPFFRRVIDSLERGRRA